MPGILPGSSILFTGMPGAGKSTMCLQLADLLQKNSNRSVLYNIGEENRSMVKIRANRIGISGNFCVSQFSEIDQLVKYCRENAVEVLFQDSLQSLRDNGASGHNLLKSVTKKLHNLSKIEDTTVFIVGHITKGGGFAGPQEIKHDVDAHVHLSLNTDSGNRIIEFQKNRFGPAMMPYEFVLSANGLDFNAVAVQDPSNEGPSKANQRKEKVLSLIKKKLLDNEFISGYCFERFNVDCSGGFWRGMLAKACKELANEGHKIGERRIDGRLHNFVEV